MRVTKEQVDRIHELLKQKDGFAASMQLFEKRLFNCDIKNSFSKNMEETSKLIFHEDEKGDIEIPPDIYQRWNTFVRRCMSPISCYRYQEQEAFQEEYDKLKEMLGLLYISETQKNKYALCSRIVTETEDFIGREEQLKEIHAHFRQENVLVLYGMRGVGKSELAKAYLNRYRECYHTVIFCSFHDNLQETIIDDYQIAVRNLSFRGKGKRGERGWYFRKKQQIIRSLVDENTLLVIDNFDVVADERLQKITELPCKVLFTSRTNANVFSLPGMHIRAFCRVQEQKELFYRYYKKRLSVEEENVLEELLEYLEGHTLSVKFAALQFSQGKESIENYLANLKNQGEKTQEISRIFRITSLSKGERAILRYVSIMPLYGIELTNLLEWCHIKEVSIVYKLIGKGYLEQNTQEGRVFMHPIVSRAVRQEEAVSFSNCWPYIQTLCMFGHQTWRKTAEEMRSYQQYIYLAVEYLQDTVKEPLFDLGYLVSGSWQLGYFNEAEAFGLKLYDYAIKIYKTDSLPLVHMRHIIGTLYDNWDKREKAAEWFKLAYFDYVKNKEPQGYYFALVSHKYGKMLRYEEEFEQSERVLLKAQDYLLKKIESDPNAVDVGYLTALGPAALMDIYMEIVELYIQWEKPKEALVWLKRREREFIERKLHLVGETSQWHLYYEMGLCQMMLKEYDEAERALDKSYSYAKRFFFEDSHYIKRIKAAYLDLKKMRGEV